MTEIGKRGDTLQIVRERELAELKRQLDKAKEIE